MRIWYGAQVKQVANQLIERDINLWLAQLIRVLDALRFQSHRLRPPVKGRPGAARDLTGLTGDLPILGPVIEAVPWSDSVPWKFDLYHSIDHIAPG